MNNSKMKFNRILKLQTGKRLFSRISDHLKINGVVLICTHTRITKLTKKHIDMIKMGKSGSLYMQRGKNWDCIDFCNFKFV